MGSKVYVRNSPDIKGSDGLWKKTHCPVPNEHHTTRAYAIYKAMNQRCRNRDEYSDCTVGFKDFQEFAEWCQSQEGYLEVCSGRFWQLDKDMLAPERRVYSPDTCMFVPSDVNLFLSTRNNSEGLQGTCFSHTNKAGVAMYRATGISSLGTFPSEVQAHNAWREWKLEVANTLVKKYAGFPKLSEQLRLWIEDFSK